MAFLFSLGIIGIILTFFLFYVSIYAYTQYAFANDTNDKSIGMAVFIIPIAALIGTIACFYYS